MSDMEDCLCGWLFSGSNLSQWQCGECPAIGEGGYSELKRHWDEIHESGRPDFEEWSNYYGE